MKYDVGNEMIYNTKVFILVRADITVTATPATEVSFKNCAPFTKCLTKIDGTTTDNDEDLDLVMAMYYLIEYSTNYSETTRKFMDLFKR